MKSRFKTRPRGWEQRAFSLLEVMIAIGIFFMAVFAILGLVSSSLANARHLKRPMVDAGVLASELSLTNQLIEGMASGDLSEFLGKAYQGYTWTYAVSEVQSNKLFQVDFIVQDNNSYSKPVVSKMSILLFRPLSPAGQPGWRNGQMNFKKPSRCRGFTMVEIMIAFAIFGMLVAAIYSTWTLILRSKQVGNAAAAQVQRQRIAVRTLEDSLTCVQSFQASMKYYSFIVLNGDQPMLSFVARVPAVFPRNGRFGDFNLRRLTFTLEPGSDSEKDLMLRQNPILMDVDSDEQSTPLVLARNVQDFIVECWDTNAMNWADEWTDTNSIPPLLRVSLVLGSSADPGDKSSALAITRVIAIPSMTLPSFLQTPKGGAAGIPNIPGIPNNQNNRNNQNNPNNPNNPNPPFNPPGPNPFGRPGGSR